MFDLDRFVEDCRSAVKADPTHKSCHDVIQRALSDPASVLASVGEPKESGIFPIFKSKDLTIINVIWKPGMTVMPHNHQMWAVIGVYTGREDNIFWRRIKDDPDGRVEAAGAKALCRGDVVPLGKDIVHSVTNPIMKLTGAIHVYGGDFFEVERSEWDPESLTERPYDMAKNRALFAK
jgi:predicted metal-dependent enzyme (double-stranded beta helix superfamily)